MSRRPPVDHAKCISCRGVRPAPSWAVCSTCPNAVHTTCVVPDVRPLLQNPNHNWRCSECKGIQQAPHHPPVYPYPPPAYSSLPPTGSSSPADPEVPAAPLFPFSSPYAYEPTAADHPSSSVELLRTTRSRRSGAPDSSIPAPTASPSARRPRTESRPRSRPKPRVQSDVATGPPVPARRLKRSASQPLLTSCPYHPGTNCFCTWRFAPLVVAGTADSHKCGYCGRAGHRPWCEGQLLGPLDDEDDDELAQFPSQAPHSAAHQIPAETPIYAHRNCIVWDPGVAVDPATGHLATNMRARIAAALLNICSKCHKPGAALTCILEDCSFALHFQCAVTTPTLMLENLSVVCPDHRPQLQENGRPAILSFRTPQKPARKEGQRCAVCLGNDFDERTGALLYCGGCEAAVHVHCLQSTPRRQFVDKQLTYFCADCAACIHCKKPCKGELTCSSCRALVHRACAPDSNPDYTQPWLCSVCRYCEHCRTEPISSSVSGDDVACAKCTNDLSTDKLCPVCCIAYNDSDDYEMVCCETCNKWVHMLCAGVDLEGLQRLSRSRRKYSCRICDSKALANSLEEGVPLVTEPASSPAKESVIDSSVGHWAGSPFTHDPEAVLGEEVGCTIDLCRLCGSGRTPRDQMRCCCDCGEVYHLRCLDTLISLDSPCGLARRARLQNCTGTLASGQPFWRCPQCTTCEVCNCTRNASSMVICDGCDRGYHQRCLDPPMERVPSGMWLCELCEACELCGTKPVKKSVTSDLCRNCSELTGRRPCSVCKKMWTSHGKASLRQLVCSDCGSVVHPHCDSLSGESARVFDDVVNRYLCPVCRESRQDQPLALGHLQLSSLSTPNDPCPQVFSCRKVGERVYVNLEDDFLQFVMQVERGDLRALHCLTYKMSRLIEWSIRESRRTGEDAAPKERERPSKRARVQYEVDLSSQVSLPETAVTHTPEAPEIADFVAWDPVRDRRICELCGEEGDDSVHGRLLWVDYEQSVHDGCLSWTFSRISEENEQRRVSLFLAQSALHIGRSKECTECRDIGATVQCDESTCDHVVHLGCARSAAWALSTSGMRFCPDHMPSPRPPTAENASLALELPDWAITKRERKGPFLPPGMIQHYPAEIGFRLGALTVIKLGWLVTSTRCFKEEDVLVPNGYTACRLFWSTVRSRQRCVYYFFVAGDAESGPQFLIRASDNPGLRVVEDSMVKAWDRVLHEVNIARKNEGASHADLIWKEWTCLKAAEAFGLALDSVMRLVERLPGALELKDYHFKSVGPAELRKLSKQFSKPVKKPDEPSNETGSARSEGYIPRRFADRHPNVSMPSFNWRQGGAGEFASGGARVKGSSMAEDVSSRHLPVAMQHRNMLKTWKKRTQIRRSGIEGWGLFATEDIEANELLIEYAGELIRPSLSDQRERFYESKGKGTYMFRIECGLIVDATMRGNWARFINHSCDPNCFSQQVEVGGGRQAIVIVTKRRVLRGEEFSYDYQFPLEEKKIPCNCGADNCRKFLN